MVCITDHWEKPDVECDLIALEELTKAMVPTKSLTMVQELCHLCSSQATSYALRRNQWRRAVRSFQVSRQFYERREIENDTGALERHRLKWELDDDDSVEEEFNFSISENIAGVKHYVCSRCLENVYGPAVVANWCLECGGIVALCSSCFERYP